MTVQPIGRILLRFDRQSDDPDRLRRQLSACVQDPQGHLWLATDEGLGLSRLTPKASGRFAKHRYTDLAERLALPEPGEELDIEGLDLDADRLWLVGSHTCTRKAVQPNEDPAEGARRLAETRLQPNRFLIACGLLAGGRLAAGPLAQLPIAADGNALVRALREDPHLGPVLGIADQIRPDTASPVAAPIAAKENGFDIEGVAARGPRLLLGLRGPVLRGWAILLEIEIAETHGHELALASLDDGGMPYRKHFVHLDGLGLRDLAWHGEDLLLLAGPTHDIAGLQQLYRLRDAATLEADSVTAADGHRLKRLYALPFAPDGDKAEGLTPLRHQGRPGLLVVYDAPRPERLIGTDGVLADIFPLPET